jgi:tryptophan synthase alpha subunit
MVLNYCLVLFAQILESEVGKVALKAAFIFVAPEVDAEKHRAVVDTPVLSLSVVGVKDYQTAVKVAEELVSQGVSAIELCAGFGVEGTAMVKQAVEGKAVVGAVRFDHHPGFDFKSGDEMFK